MTYTTGDELLDSSKQNSLDVVGKNIQDMLKKGTDGDRGMGEPEDLEDISLEEFDDYINLLSEGILKTDNGKVISSRINDTQLLLGVHYYLDINPTSIPLLGKQKVYFIEKSDFCATLYALESEKNKVRFLIEPFEDSPKKIQKLKWIKIEENDENDLNSIVGKDGDIENEQVTKALERKRFFNSLDICKRKGFRRLHEVFEESEIEDIDKYIEIFVSKNNKLNPKKKINLRKGEIVGEYHFNTVSNELNLPGYYMPEDGKLPVYYLLMPNKIFVILPMLDDNLLVHAHGIEFVLSNNYVKGMGYNLMKE